MSNVIAHQVAIHEAGHAVVMTELRITITGPIRIDMRKLRASHVPGEVPEKDWDRKDVSTRRHWAVRIVASYAAGLLAEETHGFQPRMDWYRGEGEEFTDEANVQAYALMGVLNPDERDAILHQAGGDAEKLIELYPDAKAVVDEGFQLARSVLETKRKETATIARRLLDRGEVTAEYINAIMGKS